MTIAEFIRYLQKHGIELKEHGKKHDIYWNPKTGAEIQMPRHRSQEIKKGTSERIRKELGLKTGGNTPEMF
jgi:predicted RNA binding protein YcfA (HicA-like mRNA interferase family)